MGILAHPPDLAVLLQSIQLDQRPALCAWISSGFRFLHLAVPAQQRQRPDRQPVPLGLRYSCHAGGRSARKFVFIPHPYAGLGGCSAYPGSFAGLATQGNEGQSIILVRAKSTLWITASNRGRNVDKCSNINPSKSGRIEKTQAASFKSQAIGCKPQSSFIILHSKFITAHAFPA